MRKRNDITPMDVAISGAELTLVLSKDSRYVYGELCSGSYISSSGGILIRDKKIVYNHRGISVPNVINRISESYALENSMSGRVIEFNEDYLTKAISKNNLLIVFHPERSTGLKNGNGLSIVLRNRSLVPMDVKVSEEGVAKVVLRGSSGVSPKNLEMRIETTKPEDYSQSNSILHNSVMIGFDVFGEEYSSIGRSSRGFIESLVELNNRVKDIIS